MDMHAILNWLPCSRRRKIAIARFAAGLVLAAMVPLASAHGGDCQSLDIRLQSASDFGHVECDQSSGRHGDISDAEERIDAWNSRSAFAVRHLIAGNRTYFQPSNTKSLIEPSFAKTESWAAAPGGNGFSAVRFRGWLRSHPELVLSCFVFSRFSGHVDHSSGYRHVLLGFYCANQPDTLSDAETQRLIESVKFDFE